jgi:hypothetical protein
MGAVAFRMRTTKSLTLRLFVEAIDPTGRRFLYGWFPARYSGMEARERRTDGAGWSG